MYKDYKLCCLVPVEQGRLRVKSGDVKEFHSIEGLTLDLSECQILNWWNVHMRFTNGEVQNS